MHLLRDLKNKDLSAKVVLLRLDFNTEDNWRLLASLPTIKFLTAKCKAIVIISHKGRPKGFDKSLSLRPSAGTLSRLLKKPIAFVSHFRFLEIKELLTASPKGAVYLLENLRFLDGEADNNDILAEHLASLGDFYVNDAFAVSHRANASVVAITKYLKSYAGFGLEQEIMHLTKVMKNPSKPLMVILGGAKIQDKMQVYENLKKQASRFLIGGALTPEMFSLNLEKALMPADYKTDHGQIADIGEKSIGLFKDEIKKARTIIWNGPVGNVDKKRFIKGTKEIAKAIAANKKAFKVVGGGETVMFLKKLKLDTKIDFISTGGGAMLEFLAGKKLPGVEALK